MILSEIEAVGEVVLVKEPAWSTVQANLNQFCDLKDGDLLYTKKVAQEYAKAIVKELLFEQLWNNRLYANSKIFFDKEVEKICSSIFKEDTKND
ncbi:hypothetical protein [Lactococcus lactis]|uniref:hypothetical protein n=1 Tax=Lactococcus lactis TaxID=1358 RepID=UPI00223BDF5C|nr:hypothetical protein [Lactococcus lactis]MCT1172363.1 hypothetical protein [Lactococcus lactis]